MLSDMRIRTDPKDKNRVWQLFRNISSRNVRQMRKYVQMPLHMTLQNLLRRGGRISRSVTCITRPQRPVRQLSQNYWKILKVLQKHRQQSKMPGCTAGDRGQSDIIILRHNPHLFRLSVRSFLANPTPLHLPLLTLLLPSINMAALPVALLFAEPDSDNSAEPVYLKDIQSGN